MIPKVKTGYVHTHPLWEQHCIHPGGAKDTWGGCRGGRWWLCWLRSTEDPGETMAWAVNTTKHDAWALIHGISMGLTHGTGVVISVATEQLICRWETWESAQGDYSTAADPHTENISPAGTSQTFSAEHESWPLPHLLPKHRPLWLMLMENLHLRCRTALDPCHLKW